MNGEGRPAANRAALNTDTSIVVDAATVTHAEASEAVTGLRRRRETARRLPPLADGYADSWEAPRPDRTTYRESQAWLEHSPRPKLRKRRNSVTLPPAAIAHVLEDTDRQTALIRGRGVWRLMAVAGSTEGAKWSVAAKGWVITTDALPDVLAAAQSLGAVVSYRTVGGGAE